MTNPTQADHESEESILRFHASKALQTIAIRTSYESRDDPGCGDALISVMFSVAFLESFVNEVFENTLLESRYSRKEQKKERASLVRIANLAISERWKLTTKFDMLKIHHTGSPFSRDSEPFQSFANLVRLRNAIVHPTVHKITTSQTGKKSDNTPGAVKFLASRSIIPPAGSNDEPWIDRIDTPDVAQWAVHSALLMMKEVYAFLSDMDKLLNFSPVLRFKRPS